MSDYAAAETIERVWNASIEDVWRLWTTADGLSAWIGPAGFEAEVTRLETRPGGAFDYRMSAVGESQIAWMQSQGRPTSWQVQGHFHEIEHHRRIRFESSFGGGPGMPAMSMLHTVELEIEGESVRMRFTIRAAAEAMLKGAVMGWRSCLDARFAQLLKG